MFKWNIYQLLQTSNIYKYLYITLWWYNENPQWTFLRLLHAYQIINWGWHIHDQYKPFKSCCIFQKWYYFVMIRFTSNPCWNHDQIVSSSPYVGELHMYSWPSLQMKRSYFLVQNFRNSKSKHLVIFHIQVQKEPKISKPGLRTWPNLGKKRQRRRQRRRGRGDRLVRRGRGRNRRDNRRWGARKCTVCI